MTIYTSLKEKPQRILDTCKVLLEPGRVYELRCPKAGKWGTVSGYYDDLDRLAEDAAILSGNVPGVYVTLNPVLPCLLARANNRKIEYARSTTADADIEKRRWLPLDFDPLRPAGISSADEEHLAAIQRATEARDWLKDQGFEAAVLGDSGNGGHLLYPIDLLNTEEAAALVAAIIAAVTHRYSDGKVKVDSAVFNASRIWKLYGTMVCKGDSLPDRPHRLSSILEVPQTWTPVPREVLEKVAALGKPAQRLVSIPMEAHRDPGGMPQQGEQLRGRAGIDVPAWIVKHDLGVVKEGPYREGGYRWVLERCPFSENHTDKSDTGGAVVIQRANGAIGFRCQHRSCKNLNWKAVREHYGEVAENKPRSAAAQLIGAGKQAAELFVTPEGIAYATVVNQGRKESLKVLSTQFRRWLTTKGNDLGFVPGSKAISDAAQSLEALAFQGGRKEQVFRRLARVEDHLWLDLADAEGRVVEVSRDGWNVSKECPVRFIRHDNMAPLPMPEVGGCLDDLRRFINVTEEQFPLIRGWLLDCYKGAGPYMILLINGEQGSAKSTATKLFRQLLDPVHKAPASRLQRDEWDLAISAEKNLLLCFDNVSTLPSWLSDALASLSTGAGLRIRSHYSMDEETVFGTAVPICFNGIPDFAENADLLDRAIKVTLPPISDDQRLSEDEFEAAFLAAKPKLLGALLDAVSAGLKYRESVQLPIRPRMARSALWITACETHLAGERFHAVYERNREELNALAIESSPVAGAVLAWIETWETDSWEGTMTDLLEQLGNHVSGLVAVGNQFPKTSNKLSGELGRIAPALRREGVIVDKLKQNGKRLVTIKWKPKQPTPESGERRAS